MKPGWLLALLIATGSASAQTKITIYSESGQRPMSYEENGVAKGFYIESLQKVLKKIKGYDVQIVFLPWARAVEEVRSGVGAGVMGAYYRPTERPYMNHSASIYEEEVSVHCNRDKIGNRKLQNYPADFAGLVFGNQRGYLAPGPAFFEMVKQRKISVVDGVEFSSLVKKMLVGDIDCVINPTIVMNEALAALESKGLPDRMRDNSKRIMAIKTETVHVGFSKKYEEAHPELKQFRMQFDKAAGK